MDKASVMMAAVCATQLSSERTSDVDVGSATFVAEPEPVAGKSFWAWVSRLETAGEGCGASAAGPGCAVAAEALSCRAVGLF